MASGTIIHEVGTTRMGVNNRDSVLNEHCQSCAVPNPTPSIRTIAKRSRHGLAG